MSGGVAYVLDEEHDLYLRINKELVSVEELSEKHDIDELRGLIEAHVAATGSPLGRRLLKDFDTRAADFKKIIPLGYSAMLERIAEFEAKGLDREQAELEAFLKSGSV
jgi:glutamate synthase (NADPH/NADH) large chain